VAESIAPPIIKQPEAETETAQDTGATDPAVCCDRCGSHMIETSCKLMCTNCGSRIDCSDLTLYMD
jgi:hypothetical protein